MAIEDQVVTIRFTLPPDTEVSTEQVEQLVTALGGAEISVKRRARTLGEVTQGWKYHHLLERYGITNTPIDQVDDELLSNMMFLGPGAGFALELMDYLTSLGLSFSDGDREVFVDAIKRDEVIRQRPRRGGLRRDLSKRRGGPIRLAGAR